MNLNPKTVRRVMVLMIGAGLIVATLAGVYVVRQRQIAAKYLAYRQAGMSAFAQEDYAAALKQLKQYIGKHRTDRDALFAYATSRSRVEEPDGKHLSEGIKAFQMLRDLEPDSPRVQRALLEQYTKAYYNTEGIELADKVLAKEPDHVEALRAKAIALERLRRFEEAVAVAERLNDVAPLNLDGQQLTYRLYQRTNKPGKEVVARAEAMRAKYPDDARFELLLAIAYGQSGDVEKARSLLREAAKRTPPDDPQFVRLLSMILDRNRMFAESQALLERAVAERKDPKLLAILVQRLWQNGYAKEAAERLKDLDPKSDGADSQLLALRALALFTLDRADEATPIVDALATRTSDSEAQAWATALTARFAKEPPDPRSAIAQYRAALTRDPDNGVIRYMVGEAYERLGESEPALAAWRAAAELLPSWSKPAEKMARALAATGRTEEAELQAIAARRSAPHELSPAITYVVVAFKHMGQSNDPAKVDELLKLCDSIHAAQPNEPETLPIRVALLARKGKRDEAVVSARAALSATTRPSAVTLLRLAAISRTEKLGLESEISSLIEKDREKLTPALALARAGELAAGGKVDDGLKLLEDNAKANTDIDRNAAWQLAIVQYREQTRDPKAATAWLTIGEAYPNDIAVQTAILRSGASARGDRQFVARTIDRVKQLTGEEGTLWKIERARWLLGSDKQKDYADAVIMLGDLVRASPTLIEPRLLLAAAMEKVDNESGAIKELRVAADLEPRSTAIATELARLLQAQGRFDDARVYLDRVAKNESLDGPTRRHVAAMLAQQGDSERALALLRAGASQNGLDAQGLLLLAELQRRQGLSSEADATYAKILAQPPVELEAIESAADFYASQGKREQATSILKLIDGATLQPGMRELVLARFAERHDSPEAAAKHYAAATSAAPGDVTAWRERVGYLMRSGRSAEAVTVIDDALKTMPSETSLQTLKAYAVATANGGDGQVDLKPLIDDLSKDPANDRSLKIARLLQEGAGGKLSKQEMAARFRQLADQYMRNKPLQVEAVRRSLVAGEVKRAAEIANRTLQAFPGDADVARLAVNVYRQLRDWRQMESAAVQWRARSLENPVDADIAIAEARLEAGNAAGAVAHLAPHAASAAASPDTHAAVLAMSGRALAAAGREAEARSLLEPLLGKSQRWRNAWIDIANEDMPDGKSAAAWLDIVAKHIPSDAMAERMALARAYHLVGARWQQRQSHQRAKEILVPMSLTPDASVDVYVLLASALQATGDLDAAEKNYHKALSIQPDNTAAMNNLAYLLISREGGDAAEAETLASKAVAASPNVASFHDTLARARLKAGNRSGAMESFQNALNIDPDHIEALIGKASVLAAMGQRAAVRDLLQQIESTLLRKPSLTPELTRELDSTRNTLSASRDPQ